MATNTTNATTDDSNAPSQANSMQIASIRLLSRGSRDLNGWFQIVENQLTNMGFHAVQDRYTIIVNNLSEGEQNEVFDIISQPYSPTSYQTMKDILINKFGESEESKLRRFLAREPMGDRTPSQFLTDLQYQAGKSVGENLIKLCWMDHLPSEIRTVLAGRGEITLNESKCLADAVFNAMRSYTPRTSVQAVHQYYTPPIPSNSRDDSLQLLRQEVKELALELKEMRQSRYVSEVRVMEQSENRRRHRSPSRGRSRSGSRRRQYYCWYHSTFGDEATQCRPPCHHKSGKENRSQ